MAVRRLCASQVTRECWRIEQSWYSSTNRCVKLAARTSLRCPAATSSRCRVADGLVIRPGAVDDAGIVPCSLRKCRNQPDRKTVQCRGAVSARLHTGPLEAAAKRGDPRVGVR